MKNQPIHEFDYLSSSDDSITHVVRIYADGKVSCSCRGFTTPNKCWHAKDAAAKLGRELDVQHFGASLGPPTVGQPVKKGKAKATPQLPLDDLQPAIGFIKPMLASALKDGQEIEDFMDDDYLLEEKYDGWRILVVKNHAVRCWTRQGNVYAPPQQVAEQLELLAPGTYDGEVYIPGGTGTDVSALHLQHKLRVALFDILRVGAESCTGLVATERRALLEVAASKVDGATVYVAPQVPVTLKGLKAIWKRGGEGAIIKRKDVRYRPGKRIQRVDQVRKRRVS